MGINLVGVTPEHIDQMKANVSAALVEAQEANNALAMIDASLAISRDEELKDILSYARDVILSLSKRHSEQAVALQYDVGLYAAAGVLASDVGASVK